VLGEKAPPIALVGRQGVIQQVGPLQYGVVDHSPTVEPGIPEALPAIPPIENSTSGGTPAATQKAPFQSSERINPPPDAASDPSVSTIATIDSLLDQFAVSRGMRVPLFFVDRAGLFAGPAAS